MGFGANDAGFARRVVENRILYEPFAFPAGRQLSAELVGLLGSDSEHAAFSVGFGCRQGPVCRGYLNA